MLISAYSKVMLVTHMYILFRLFSSVVYHRLLNVVPWTSCLSYAVCPEDECSLFPHQLAYLIGYILPPSIRSFCFKFQLWVSNSRFRGNGSPWPQLRMSSLGSGYLLFSRSVVCDSLRPHGLQHARLPCPSPSPRVCSNSCPLG